MCSLAVEVGEDGEDAAAVVGGGGEVEFGEDVVDVFADGFFGDVEASGDGGVGAAFGHFGEDFAFAGGELAEGALAVLAGEELGDDGGVHGGAAGGDAADGFDELADVEDAVFEEVADASGVVGEEFAGVELFDVLGEDEDGQAGDLGAGGDGGLEAFVGEGGGESDVDDGDVGVVVGEGFVEVGAVVDGGDDGEVVGLEEFDQSFSEEGEVFGDDNAHGISRVTMVGPPVGLVMFMVPSKASMRRRMPARPLPGAASAPPWPLSVTVMTRRSSPWLMWTHAWVASACLAVLVRSSAMAK